MDSKAHIEYFCARGHVTRVPFSATALFSVPPTWQCEVCFEEATRTPPGVKPVDPSPAGEDLPAGDERHAEEAKARRSAREQEQILRDALEKLRKTE